MARGGIPPPDMPNITHAWQRPVDAIHPRVAVAAKKGISFYRLFSTRAKKKLTLYETTCISSIESKTSLTCSSEHQSMSEFGDVTTQVFFWPWQMQPTYIIVHPQIPEWWRHHLSSLVMIWVNSRGMRGRILCFSYVSGDPEQNNLCHWLLCNVWFSSQVLPSW